MGPYSPDQVLAMLSSGLLDKYDLYWHEGMLDWAPVAALKPVDQTPPPPVYIPQTIQTPPTQQYQGFADQAGYPIQRKSRVAYILLGLFLGGLGIHNFYAGYAGKGVAQLLITLLTGWLIIPLLFVGIWVLVEVCIETKDARGIPFQ